MPIRPDLQHLEKCIDDALRKNDFKPLKTLLQIDICEDVKIKCSKQFFHKVDNLICRELDKEDIHNVSAILVSVGRCGKNISVLGQAGLLTMIKQGLIQKMVAWFEKSKEIIQSQGNSKDEAVLNMIEDLVDLLLVIHDVSDEGKKQVVESFVPRICSLVIDSRVNICIQQEIIKKMNAMLDKMPQDARKILSNQEMLILMSSMGERILDAGDYDLQVGIVEALCRMTTEKQRQELAHQWFSMDFIAKAFERIKDSEFETDCRIFLNLVNGMLGDKRRVFTFPCLSAFLDKYELQIPSDEKLEEFWIDFNLGSQTLSFYIAGDNDDHQWEAVTVPEEKVQIYSIEVRESKKLLTIILKNIVKISKREGKELLLYFDASLEITNVTQKIFGANKHRESIRKQGISVAKTSLHILFDASGSQILVPESQISPVREELVSLKEKSKSPKEFAKPSKYIKNSNKGNRNDSQLEIITPSKRKMSEASMIVSGADRYTVRSPVLFSNTSIPPRRRRIKPPLQMTSSAEKPSVSQTSENGMDNAASLKSRPSEERHKRDNTDKHIKTAKCVENTENMNVEFSNQNFDELQDVIPDSQAVEKRDHTALPGVLDNISGNKMHSKWACWTPVTNIELCNNQRASTSSGDTFNQDIVINKKLTKQKSSSSISDHNSEETGKVKYKNERTDHLKIDKAEVEVCKKHNQQQNHPKYPGQKSTENAKQSDWPVESETTFKSVLLNKTIEESLIYRKKYVLSKDVNTATCDKNPSASKNMQSHRKAGKELTSELNSWDLKQKKMREKSKGKEFTHAAESLISQINKRYKTKDDIKSTRKLKESLINSGFSNKSVVQLSKEKVQKKSYRKLKTTFVNVTSECPLNDVYNFNLNGADDPIIKLGIQEFQAAAKEACADKSIRLVGPRNHDELKSSVKTKDKKIITNHQKKNLFSDTETEYRCDDSKTDISWLREPKSKPQLIDYSRNKNVKNHKSGKSRSSLEKGQPSSKMIPSKNITKKMDKTVPEGRIRLPRKATKTKKNYKDLSNSESECEQEFSHSFKENLLVKEENIRSRMKTVKLPKKQQKVFHAETEKELSKPWKNSCLLKDTIRDNCLDLSPRSLSGSPSSIEVTRGVEKITEKDFTQDFDCITKSISPYPKTSSLESLNSNSGVGGTIKSPKNNEKNFLCASESCSPIPRPLFLPRHTPTKSNTIVNRKKKSSLVLTQETQNRNSYSDVSSYSSEKRFMEIESPNINENYIQSKREESHSASSLSKSSEGREKMWFDMPCDATHVSGPTQHLSRKRIYIEDNLSNSNEVEMEEKGERRANLLPKKLCKIEDADHHIHKMSESISSLSTNDFSIPWETWQNEFAGIEMTYETYERLNSEFKRRNNIRHKMLSYFTTQSWKTAQQHLRTMNHQSQDSRIKKLDKFQFIIIEELENFEKDSQSLKDLEKEFVDFWEKIFQKFSVYQKSEQQRLHLLKTSLAKSVFCTTDNEETIFTSEMCLMKEDMKVLQDRLLKDMLEEELLNVRRELMSVFMSHEKNVNV
uniref:Synaptonemal complex protein 2 n=1 Tax=Macaca nemestrina TaxID=9545 RepID=A0A2K6CCA8_MACNE|nr:synaptonemal complex protein 2 [Macaca nemestrina]XP_011720950.1 synaptonemal complex protein 2 [Macaca nemestrina]XP_011720951.1 synaptonemal complex protein 2 [Macaca nemestrina]XP_011720952.1 synaptonemal complex protein 2 [Macaca nemestrina]XP_011720954.1 synaptonemal complex protein 2 [Macaca nemestrina]